MREVIFLVADRHGVRRMTKNLPSLNRGEIPIKVKVEVEEQAFRTPVIEKEIYVEDWREGIDMADVEFNLNAITKEEAEIIKQKRFDKMQSLLEAQGYAVTKPEGVE